ncbi:hypothetical protein QJS83_09225 [Bdellovibrio sp. 22V]|uniref:CFI-box-CTERM domain-containing protein n=1 Tax=Bdellovibrio TaxID=958 RepID=UPI002543AA09|nr:CFI-box-CTERM domain-containing protein [Bdellovibrio sp. 22V]WII70638.1 hypothetical protein QJS83_09225 [Bdellovibrio sp. 22V]
MALLPRIGFRKGLTLPALLLGAGLSLFSAQTLATVELVSISGVSNQDLTTLTKPLIYGGFTGGCTGDGISTCDSCTGAAVSGSKLWTCNKTNAYPNLRMTIQVSTNTAGASATNYLIKVNEDKFTPTISPTFADGILTVQMTWGEFCNAAGQGSSCATSFSADLQVGFEITNSGTTTADTLPFKVSVRAAATDGSDWFYTDCNTADATASIGFCHFETFPGDQKIYADNLVVAPGYPASTAAGINYTDLVFFYEEQQTAEADTATVARISNASPFFTIGVQETASPPVADNRIDGLTNGTRYCMVMANQDATGIISFFTPAPGHTTTPTPVPIGELCTTPAEVVGLLDDKKCFIATAAFGSEMAPEVQSFRDFRNKYLLPYSWGKSFVKFYYKHSPYYAHMIAESEVAKTVVRAALWPLLFFARMSVSFGFWATLLIWSLVAVSAYELYRRVIVGRRYRGEP